MNHPDLSPDCAPAATRAAQNVLALFATTLAILLVPACSAFQPPPESLTLGVPPLEQDALMYVADDQGFFASNGVKVTWKNYDTGLAAINGVEGGQADIAEAAEYPFVGFALHSSPLAIIASNDRFENDYVVGRKDRGIHTIADLKGKRVGVTRGTITEFYLGRFLELNALRLEDVIVVDTPPTEFVDALVKGEVDAMVAWQPYVSQMLAKLGDQAVAWPAQSNQAAYGILVGRRDWLRQHAATLEKFLHALAQAEDFIARYPDEAKSIVKKRLNYEDAYLASVWPQHEFALRLDFSLVVALNDEARWMIAHKTSSETGVPNFLDDIDADGLKTVKPSAVDLIR